MKRVKESSGDKFPPGKFRERYKLKYWNTLVAGASYTRPMVQDLLGKTQLFDKFCLLLSLPLTTMVGDVARNVVDVIFRLSCYCERCSVALIGEVLPSPHWCGACAEDPHIYCRRCSHMCQGCNYKGCLDATTDSNNVLGLCCRRRYCRDCRSRMQYVCLNCMSTLWMCRDCYSPCKKCRLKSRLLKQDTSNGFIDPAMKFI